MKATSTCMSPQIFRQLYTDYGQKWSWVEMSMGQHGDWSLAETVVSRNDAKEWQTCCGLNQGPQAQASARRRLMHLPLHKSSGWQG